MTCRESQARESSGSFYRGTTFSGQAANLPRKFPKSTESFGSFEVQNFRKVKTELFGSKKKETFLEGS